jgi:hypothetical protein
MEAEILRSLVSRHRKERTIENWILLENHIENKKSCKDCGGSIYYENSLIRLSKENRLVYDKVMPSCRTNKKIDDRIYYLQVCQKCIIEKFPEYLSMNKSRVFNTVNKISTYAFNIPEEEGKKFTKGNGITLANLVKKYGEENGNEKWENYRRIQSVTNTFEYKKGKYGWSEDDFKKFNKSRAVTLVNMIEKHGKEAGKEFFDAYVKKQRVNGKTLDWFKEKLGEKEGKIKYAEISLRKSKGGITSGVSYSKVSQDFLDSIDIFFSKNYSTYYAKKNYEHTVYSETLNRCYLVDYFIEELKVCIEFNGDYFHANPKKYGPESEFYGLYKFPIKAKSLWEKDKIKKDVLMNEFGIKTVVVWESDYYKNKDNKEFYKKIVKKCIKK